MHLEITEAIADFQQHLVEQSQRKCPPNLTTNVKFSHLCLLIFTALEGMENASAK